ncbi:MAG: hypothetical protein K6F92_10100 [Lachnospiraceae bacterium]|nr:hypothetical protein [Lachnospiraceae bacterium]
MWIVLHNIKQLIKNNTRFFLLILMAQIMGTFAICFSVGVLVNNSYLIVEDEKSARRIYIDFERSYYEDYVYDYSTIVTGLAECFHDDVAEVWYSNSRYKDGNALGRVSVADVKDGKISYNDSLAKFDNKIYEGRNLQPDDYDEARRVALVRGISQDKTVLIGTEEYEIVGRMDSDIEGIVIYIPATAWNIPVLNMTIVLDRVPTLKEYNSAVSLLNELVGMGEYKISEYYAGSADMKALYVSIFIAVTAIGVSVVGTIFVICGYVYETRKKSLVVMKLCGCTSMYALKCYMMESLILSFVSCVLGLALFLAARIIWLDAYYPYIRVMFDCKMYILCGFGLVPMVAVENLCLSWVKSRVTIKEQLQSARG